MTQIILNIENQSVAKALRALIKNMSGVHIVNTRKRQKSGFELAMEDVKAGRMTEYASVKDLINKAKS